MGTILIGTTSWTDKTLVDSGLFYPGTAKTAEARLRYYASRFPIVEVDSSYYGMPSEYNSRLWVARTPEAFVFDIKAFRLFTGHQTSPAALPADIRKALGTIDNKNIYYRDVPEDAREELWRRFRLSLDPLQRPGKLGGIGVSVSALVCVRKDKSCAYPGMCREACRIPDRRGVPEQDLA